MTKKIKQYRVAKNLLTSALLASVLTQSNAFAVDAIYSMSDSESHVARMLMQNSLSVYLDHEVNVPEEDKYYKVSTTEFVAAFHQDSMSAIDRYLGAKVLISGKATKAGLLPNGQPYMDFQISNLKASLQALMAKNEPVPKIKTGEEVSVYCTSGGELAGTLLLIDCYTRERIEAHVSEVHMTQMQEFMYGAKPTNTAIPQAALMSILAIEHLPKTSVCFDLQSTDYRACASDVHRLDKDTIMPKFDTLVKSLKERGLKI